MTPAQWFALIGEYGPYVVFIGFLLYCITKLAWEVFNMMRNEIKAGINSILETQKSIMSAIERQALIMEERIPRQGGSK